MTVAAADEVKEGEEEEPASGAYVPSGRGLIPAQLDPTGESARSSDTGAIEHGEVLRAHHGPWTCASCTYANSELDYECEMVSGWRSLLPAARC